MKIICADRVSVGLSYDANFKWHMPICVERCRAEQKYMLFWDRHRARSPEKYQSTGTYVNHATLRSGFFPRNALGDGPAFWIFPGLTDKG